MSKIQNASGIADFIPRIGTGVVATRQDTNGKQVFRENRLTTKPYHTNKMGVPIRMAKVGCAEPGIVLRTK